MSCHACHTNPDTARRVILIEVIAVICNRGTAADVKKDQGIPKTRIIHNY